MKVPSRATTALISLLACVPLAFGQYGQSRAPENTTVYRDLAYVYGGHQRQKLDLYLPKDGTNLPLIINIHGGAFKMGSKEDGVPLGYLAQGYAVASINYRLSQHAVFPAQIQDCKAAVRWLRAHAGEYRLDPRRFAAWGSSAGGHLAAMLGTTGDAKELEVGGNLNQPSRVQAVVDYFGPTDFLQMDAHRLPNGMVHDAPDSPESELVGGPIQQDQEKTARANPITYVTRNAPPFLICHGDADPLVPHHQSELLEAALKKAGVPVTCYTVKGAGHGGFKDPKVPIMTREFLAKYLQPDKPGSGHALGAGSRFGHTAVVVKYPDGRPAAAYRLEAQDHGVVLRHGAGPGNCDALGTRDVWVWQHGGTYYMHYDGAGPKGWLACLATSRDLVNWTAKGPVLELGKAGEDDSASASYGVTFFDGRAWHMFYLGTPHVTPAPDFIPAFPYLTMKARSDSPEGPWQKQRAVTPFRTKPGTYYSATASPGQVVRRGRRIPDVLQRLDGRPHQPHPQPGPHERSERSLDDCARAHCAARRTGGKLFTVLR